MNVGIILAAGASERFKSKVYKQYLKLNGKEVIYYTICEMRAANCFDEIIAVTDKEEFNENYISNKYNIKCIEGGDTRNKSIYNAIDYVKKNYKADKIVFHDCARPFIKKEIFVEFIKFLDKNTAVALTTAISDSLVTTTGDFVKRTDYNLIQTPEAFRFDSICNDFDATSKETAIINQLKDKSKILLYKSTAFNFKITYPEDLFLAEQLMRINYLHTFSSKSYEKKPKYKLGKVLIIGGSGGVGQAIINELKLMDTEFYAPTHNDLDLCHVTVESIKKVCPFVPDIIINTAATYAADDAGLLETYDKIFDVNLRANLVLIEYAKTLNKRVNIVVMSSSSSTMGRINLTNYSAAKAALNSIVESQGKKLAQQNIYLNAIIPEKINTPLIEKLHKTAINTRELLDVNEVIDALFTYAITDNYGKLVHIRKGL
ncbi:MAG: SDR family NAD(P)-dependent oxidoreductase [Clostridia bacterium]